MKTRAELTRQVSWLHNSALILNGLVIFTGMLLAVGSCTVWRELYASKPSALPKQIFDKSVTATSEFFDQESAVWKRVTEVMYLSAPGTYCLVNWQNNLWLYCEKPLQATIGPTAASEPTTRPAPFKTNDWHFFAAFETGLPTPVARTSTSESSTDAVMASPKNDMAADSSNWMQRAGSKRLIYDADHDQWR